MKKVLACLGVAVGSIVASSAAASDSERGAGYIQAHPLGVQVALPTAADALELGAQYLVEVHGGYHVSGRHDGFVVGASQKLAIASGTLGATVARVGYDVAIPFGRRELTIAPYAFGGVAYPLAEGDPAWHAGVGVEVRVFPVERLEDEVTKEVVKTTRRVIVAADKVEIREKIQFRHNESVIESSSDSLLDEIASVIRANPQLKRLRIEGHASAEGDASANRKLSEARAQAVRDQLVARGVPEDVLEAEGYGADNPIATNDTEEGREKNRRVEIDILEQDDVVERVEEELTPRDGAPDGLFVVVKLPEVGVVTGDPVVVTLGVQAGIGYAF